MPKPQGLTRRGNTYYIRVRVPNDVAGIINKSEISRSLKTTDYKEACRRIAAEQVLINAEFQDARDRIQQDSCDTKHSPNDKNDDLSSLSRDHMIALCIRWLKAKEDQHEISMAQLHLEEHERYELLDTFRTDEGLAHYAFMENDFNFCLKKIIGLLEHNNINYDTNSKAFKAFGRIFLELYAGSAERKRKRFEGRGLDRELYPDQSGGKIYAPYSSHSVRCALPLIGPVHSEEIDRQYQLLP